MKFPVQGVDSRESVVIEIDLRFLLANQQSNIMVWPDSTVEARRTAGYSRSVVN